MKKIFCILLMCLSINSFAERKVCFAYNIPAPPPNNLKGIVTGTLIVEAIECKKSECKKIDLPFLFYPKNSNEKVCKKFADDMIIEIISAEDVSRSMKTIYIKGEGDVLYKDAIVRFIEMFQNPKKILCVIGPSI